MDIFLEVLSVLEPGSAFLMDLGAILLKCNHQGRQCPYLLVSVGGQEPNFWWATICKQRWPNHRETHLQTQEVTTCCTLTDQPPPNILLYFPTVHPSPSNTPAFCFRKSSSDCLLPLSSIAVVLKKVFLACLTWSGAIFALTSLTLQLPNLRLHDTSKCEELWEIKIIIFLDFKLSIVEMDHYKFKFKKKFNPFYFQHQLV